MTIKQTIYGIALCAGLLMPTGILYAKTPDPDGVKAGNVIFNFGAFADVGYDSNIGHDNEQNSAQDGFVEVGAKIRTKMDNTDENDWTADIQFSWVQDFGLGTYKEQERLSEGGFSITAATQADLWKTRAFRLMPSFSYTYVDSPEDEFLREDLKNHSIYAGIAAYIQPGSGKIFSEKIAYSIRPKIYTEQDTTSNINPQDLSTLYHSIQSVTQWNFLPVSSLTLDLDFRIVQYINQSDRFVNSYPIRAKLGIQGLLLARMNYALDLGYAYTFYDRDKNTNINQHLFIMNFNFGYSFTDNLKISVRYRNDFENSNVGDFFKYHNVGLAFNGFFIDHLSTDAEIGYSHMTYVGGASNGRTDDLITANVGIDYVFFPGFSIGLDYRLRFLAATSALDSYIKHVALFNISYEY